MSAAALDFGASAAWPVLPFRIGPQWYAVTLEELVRLCSIQALQTADLPLAVLPEQNGGALAVLLQGQRGVFALLADEAETILSAPPEQRLLLPPLLQTRQNAWLAGAFYWAERNTLCFLLRSSELEPQEDAT